LFCTLDVVVRCLLLLLFVPLIGLHGLIWFVLPLTRTSLSGSFVPLRTVHCGWLLFVLLFVTFGSFFGLLRSFIVTFFTFVFWVCLPDLPRLLDVSDLPVPTFRSFVTLRCYHVLRIRSLPFTPLPFLLVDSVTFVCVYRWFNAVDAFGFTGRLFGFVGFVDCRLPLPPSSFPFVLLVVWLILPRYPVPLPFVRWFPASVRSLIHVTLPLAFGSGSSFAWFVRFVTVLRLRTVWFHFHGPFGRRWFTFALPFVALRGSVLFWLVGFVLFVCGLPHTITLFVLRFITFVVWPVGRVDFDLLPLIRLFVAG